MNAIKGTAMRAVYTHTLDDGRRVFAMVDAEGRKVATYFEEPLGI